MDKLLSSWTKTFVVSILLFFSINISAQTPEDLMSGDYNFKVADHVVGTSMFHWYTSYGGQVSGPWVPIEGRENWTGEVEFWKRMIKQSMAANIDVFYVHLIPHMDQQRINLFQALYELREIGWDVPKVCPFFDPMITYSLQGSNVDVSTEAGKDELMSHYIRFYEQYYSQNQDEFADDYIYTIDGAVVLDTWHVHLNITNYAQLTRYDVESRLSNHLGRAHSVFYNGIRMITNAVSPSFAFADEKVHQFEVHEYYIEKEHNFIRSAQIKPGYWDQNVRDPGYIMPRNGGAKYKNAWSQLSPYIHRIYIESFNEYDEGSGIFAAKTDEIYFNSINTSSDTWSDTDDPYEYIKTTAAGAAAFNDDEALNSKILYHTIPDAMFPGDTINVKIVMRNTGNAQWSNAEEFKFGQQEGADPVVFGENRYLIDDSKDDIPEFGGIFRGRTITFNLEIIAPETEGVYPTHWGMVQEYVAWFGEILEKTITVSLTAEIKQQEAQNIFNIYPNPVIANGDIKIYGDLHEKDKIIVFNTNGSKVFEGVILDSKKNYSLNLQNTDIKEGLYIIQIISNNSIYTKKILVHKV